MYLLTMYLVAATSRRRGHTSSELSSKTKVTPSSRHQIFGEAVPARSLVHYIEYLKARFVHVSLNATHRYLRGAMITVIDSRYSALLPTSSNF